MTPLGLIAGQGILPIETAAGMRALGRPVICAALSGNARVDELRPLCQRLHVVGLLRLNDWSGVLKRYGCREAVMVGRVGASEMHARFHLFRYVPDWRTARVWFVRTRHDKRNDRLLAAIADELQSGGITLIDGRPFVPESPRHPRHHDQNAAHRRDSGGHRFRVAVVATRWRIAHRPGGTCRDKHVLAVEAVEGTDRLIERTGQVCKRKGWILCKAANPNQDMRLLTCRNDRHRDGGDACRNTAAAIVLEVGRTIMLEKEKLLARADQLGIAVVGR